MDEMQDEIEVLDPEAERERQEEKLQAFGHTV